jgi:hypothetical protein
MIEIKNVTKLYPAKAAGKPTSRKGSEKWGTPDGAIHALDHISLHVARANGYRSWGRRDRGNRRW